MLEFRGFTEMQQRLRETAEWQSQRAGRAVYRQAEKIMARSKDEFVPVDTGVLKASGHVEPPRRNVAFRWTVELAYGGAARTYAIRQHETPWYNHTVGQWKFLETPLMEAVPDLLAAYAAELKL